MGWCDRSKAIDKEAPKERKRRKKRYGRIQNRYTETLKTSTQEKNKNHIRI
jgi:hypothetical protein